MKPDITAIVNLHREGYLCKPSLKSVERAQKFAHEQGVSVEVILIFDKADDLTLNCARAQKRADWVDYEVAHGDLGASRNFGVGRSGGELVAFLDGDDIWGENWLFSFVSMARKATRKMVWHPEVSIYFGGACHVFHHVDMEDADFDLLDLSFGNLWTALSCTHRDVLMEIPYPITNLSKGLGYEDWGWNLQLIEKGYIHKIIRGAGPAIRVKVGQSSLLRQTNEAGAIPYPTLAFRSLLSRQVSGLPVS